MSKGGKNVCFRIFHLGGYLPVRRIPCLEHQMFNHSGQKKKKMNNPIKKSSLGNNTVSA
jgi:hypothetical protein